MCHSLFRIPVTLMLTLILLLSAAPTPMGTMSSDAVPWAPPASAEFVPGELLVHFAPGATTAAAKSTLEGYDADVISSLYNSDVLLVRVPGGREREIAGALGREPGVLFAEPNYFSYAVDPMARPSAGVSAVESLALSPNDPHYSKQWAHTQIMQSAAAWDIHTGSSAVIIAIIDSGIDPGHPDLAGKIVPGYDFVANDSDPRDENGHGTHVAGIAAAMTNNGVGIAGMSWGARIMPVRVLDVYGQGPNSGIINGINWARAHGAKVINLSLGGHNYSQAMQDAVTAAHNAGILVIAAMGNCRTSGAGCPSANPTAYPAALDHVMAVAATTRSDTYAGYSQYGSHCDIAAPGGDMMTYGDANGIYSTMPTYNVRMTTHEGFLKNYDYLRGTSMAAPYVAGLAALIWSAAPALTPAQVQGALQSTAVDLGAPGWDVNYGHGRIDARAALALVALPGAPALFEIDNPSASGSFLVDWGDIPNVAGYQLQESTSATFDAISQTYTPAVSQQSIIGKAPGIWHYRVRAGNAAGVGAWSAARSVAVFDPPLLSPISISAGSYSVSWPAVDLAVGYILEEAQDHSFSDAAVAYTGASTSYPVTWQPAGTWYYRVRAVRGPQKTPWSHGVSAAVPAYSISPPALSILGNAGDDTYIVAWGAVSGATAYILEESCSPYFSAPYVVFHGSGTEHNVAGQPGGTWYYRVRAEDGAGGSQWSARQQANVAGRFYLPHIRR